MADALRELGVPVVGGNVSLYNESGDGPIYPTPVVGMVGALPDAERAAPGWRSPQEGDAVALLRPVPPPTLPGCELAKLRGQRAARRAARGRRGARSARAQEAVRDAVRAGELASAHDIAEGGFLVAVAECCLAGGIGAELDLGATATIALRHLFGEGARRLRGVRPARGSRPAGGAHAAGRVRHRRRRRAAATIAGRWMTVPLAELGERAARWNAPSHERPGGDRARWRWYL